jgi:hypothetical protein
MTGADLALSRPALTFPSLVSPAHFSFLLPEETKSLCGTANLLYEPAVQSSHSKSCKYCTYIEIYCTNTVFLTALHVNIVNLCLNVQYKFSNAVTLTLCVQLVNMQEVHVYVDIYL